MQIWDKVYSKRNFGEAWLPREGVVRFSARYLKRRVGVNSYGIKRRIKRVIDVGCGNGRHVKFFAEEGYSVYGIDISRKAIEIAKSWLKRENLNADLSVGNIENLPFKNNFFDVAIVDGVLDHVPFSNAIKTMKEIERVCVPGAYVYITLRSTEDSEFGRGKKIEDNTFILQEGYEKNIIQHFFDLEQIRKITERFRVLDIEIDEERSLSFLGLDKSFLESSKRIKNYVDLSKPIDLDLKSTRWHVTLEKKEDK
jgi:ubiquinone/menaquinone biosynthesis C-methylase UbiE